VWYGVIFIRQGLYRKGVFKFVLSIPDTYPDVPPQFKFLTPVYHPLVSPRGEVDIKRAFPQWVAYRDQIWCVLAYVKKLFYKIETEEALHIEAAAMFLTDASKFQRSVSSCVEASLRDVYINHQDSSLRFSEWNQHLNNLSDCLLDVQLPSPRLVASHIVSLTLFAVSSLEGR